MATLSLRPIIDISVNLAAKAATRKGFNLALIIGTSQVIPELERVRVYTAADELLADGFTKDSAEYKAALLYFSARTKPARLAVGVKLEGDDDYVAAVSRCREANSEWYVYVPLGATDEDIEALAKWTEAATPDTLLAYTTKDGNNLSRQEEEDDYGIFRKLHEKRYRRSFGVYSTDAENPNAVVSIIGYAMGATKATNRSAYTLAYKDMPGVRTEALLERQVEYITQERGNAYVCRAEQYNVFQQGTMADGSSFDEVLNLDILKNDILLNVMDLLTSSRKVPQTEGGVASIVNVINVACDKHVNTGFISPGMWKGGDVLDLADGDYLMNGYLVQSEPLDTQSQADRDARKSPPIYVSVKLAGAIEFVTIEVFVNR